MKTDDLSRGKFAGEFLRPVITADLKGIIEAPLKLLRCIFDEVITARSADSRYSDRLVAS